MIHLGELHQHRTKKVHSEVRLQHYYTGLLFESCDQGSFSHLTLTITAWHPVKYINQKHTTQYQIDVQPGNSSDFLGQLSRVIQKECEKTSLNDVYYKSLE